MKNIQKLIFVVALVFLISCGGSNNKVQENQDPIAEDTTNTDNNTQDKGLEGFKRVEVEGLYALQIPDFLTPYSDLNDVASLQYAYESDNLFLIIIDELKTDIPEGRTLEDYYDFANNNLTEGLHSISLEDFRTLNVNGLNGIFWNIEGSTQLGEGEAITVVYQVKVIESPTAFYQIISWTTWENREKYKKELDIMVGSFEEI